jgi:hypothetical protein
MTTRLTHASYFAGTNDEGGQSYFQPKHTPLEPLLAVDTRWGRHPLLEPHQLVGSRFAGHPTEHLTITLARAPAAVE